MARTKRTDRGAHTVPASSVSGTTRLVECPLEAKAHLFDLFARVGRFRLSAGRPAHPLRQQLLRRVEHEGFQQSREDEEEDDLDVEPNVGR